MINLLNIFMKYIYMYVKLIKVLKNIGFIYLKIVFMILYVFKFMMDVVFI